jgi:hypothetical protein
MKPLLPLLIQTIRIGSYVFESQERGEPVACFPFFRFVAGGRYRVRYALSSKTILGFARLLLSDRMTSPIAQPSQAAASKQATHQPPPDLPPAFPANPNQFKALHANTGHHVTTRPQPQENSKLESKHNVFA